jgi:hypothetical protein
MKERRDEHDEDRVDVGETTAFFPEVGGRNAATENVKLTWCHTNKAMKYLHSIFLLGCFTCDDGDGSYSMIVFDDASSQHIILFPSEPAHQLRVSQPRLR